MRFNSVIDANGKGKIQPAADESTMMNFMEFTVSTKGMTIVDLTAVDVMTNPPRKCHLAPLHLRIPPCATARDLSLQTISPTNLAARMHTV